MREILFRGRIEGTDNWVYGAFATFYTMKGNSYPAIIPICDNEVNSIENISPIDLITLGQYTGIEDMTGVKIFEGDIVRYNHGEISSIFYSDGAFRNSSFCGKFVLCKESAKYCEIIGNVYDNPELLTSSVE